TIVMSIVIVLFGAIGFTYLGLREYPSVDPPIVTVSTSYTGANAEVIESQITEPLEASISGISGIKTLSSQSSDGRSNIVVEFELGVDMEAAANDVRDKVSRALRSLPPDTDPPIVTKSDADAQTIFSVTVQSDRRTLLELSELGNNVFKERLQTIPGVSEVRIWGEKRYSMKLEFDQLKLAAFDLTPLDVRNALLRENVEIPSGRIEGSTNELTIRTLGRLVTEDEFNNLIITEKEGNLIRLSQIGQARLAPENERTLMRGNGNIPMIGVSLNPQPGANYIDIVDEALKRVEQIKRELPPDVITGIGMDATASIRKAITEVEETILLAFLLVVIIIFLFLRDWRTTVIPIIAIPISLIGAFFIMYIADFTINILTLLAIVLTTGIVVDDAIVVMENIYAKVEKGMKPMAAAYAGSEEIFFAIISTTITLSAVFLPIIFLQGLTGRLFREFGIVVAGSVIISAFVSLSLTPMMSSRLLKHREKPTWFFRKTEPFFLWLITKYNTWLTGFLKAPWMAIIIMFGAVGTIYFIGRQIPSELAPMEDKSSLRITTTAPEGTSYDKMDEYITEIGKVVDTLGIKQTLMLLTSPGFGGGSSNSGFAMIRLTPPNERKKSQAQLASELNAIVSKMNFARSFVVQDQTISTGRMGGFQVQFVIQATDFEKLKGVVPVFLDSLSNSPVFSQFDVNLKFNKPELRVEIDRNKAREMGVSVRDIAETLQLFFSGNRFGYFIFNGKQYQVIGQAARSNRDEPIDLKIVGVRNKFGDIVQLDNLVHVTYQSSPPTLYRYNRYSSATISGNPVDGLTIGQGIEEMRRISEEVLDDTFSTSLSGISKDFEESSNSLLFAFVLALVVVYLVLAAQFESFSDPLIIMFTVPLALAGALITLKIFGHTLNIFSQIGIIMLVGIVTKNGILIVEFANQRKLTGLSLKEAVIGAATQRFRPILMTSLSTILGAVPIAMALGGGATSRIPMGVAIIGGLSFSLILTLFVIPALYLYLSRSKTKIKNAEA
ncbi:MAG TPA: efflux RND transporter permease subunit, partial [Cyclobacteriaceae bacterium]|nr:efflux RND transporter permease subunit [Cyclobacteriaceae bacterium]